MPDATTNTIACNDLSEARQVAARIKAAPAPGIPGLPERPMGQDADAPGDGATTGDSTSAGAAGGAAAALLQEVRALSAELERQQQQIQLLREELGRIEESLSAAGTLA